MVSLLDVNVLVALVVPEHEHHEPALGRPHEFWPDVLSPAVMSEVRLAETGKQLTDRYLLGLARRHGGRLVTFDRGIAVVGGDDVTCLLPATS